MNIRGIEGNINYRVVYRYFTTVIYVCIAYIKGLTREIDNYNIVKDFFECEKKKNS